MSMKETSGNMIDGDANTPNPYGTNHGRFRTAFASPSPTPFVNAVCDSQTSPLMITHDELKGLMRRFAVHHGAMREAAVREECNEKARRLFQNEPIQNDYNAGPSHMPPSKEEFLAMCRTLAEPTPASSNTKKRQGLDDKENARENRIECGVNTTPIKSAAEVPLLRTPLHTSQDFGINTSPSLIPYSPPPSKDVAVGTPVLAAPKHDPKYRDLDQSVSALTTALLSCPRPSVGTASSCSLRNLPPAPSRDVCGVGSRATSYTPRSLRASTSANTTCTADTTDEDTATQISSVPTINGRSPDFTATAGRFAGDAKLRGAKEKEGTGSISRQSLDLQFSKLPTTRSAWVARLVAGVTAPPPAPPKAPWGSKPKQKKRVGSSSKKANGKTATRIEQSQMSPSAVTPKPSTALPVTTTLQGPPRCRRVVTRAGAGGGGADPTIAAQPDTATGGNRAGKDSNGRVCQSCATEGQKADPSRPLQEPHVNRGMPPTKPIPVGPADGSPTSCQPSRQTIPTVDDPRWVLSSHSVTTSVTHTKTYTPKAEYRDIQAAATPPLIAATNSVARVQPVVTPPHAIPTTILPGPSRFRQLHAYAPPCASPPWSMKWSYLSSLPTTRLQPPPFRGGRVIPAQR